MPPHFLQYVKGSGDDQRFRQIRTNFLLRFCRTWPSRYLMTSQTRVKCVSWIDHWTILRMVCQCILLAWGWSGGVSVWREDGPHWCVRPVRLTLVCEVIRDRFKFDKISKKEKKDFSGWRTAIVFLHLFFFHFLLCSISFVSQNKSQIRMKTVWMACDSVLLIYLSAYFYLEDHFFLNVQC